MPKFFKDYLESLSDSKAHELAVYFDGAMELPTKVIKILISPRSKLHKKWNMDLGEDKKKK